MRVHPALPIVLFLAVVLAACLLGGLLRKRLCKTAEEKTHLRVFDLPLMAGMRERGWFEISEADKGVTHYVFAKKRMRQGIYTGTEPLSGGEAHQA